MNETPLLIGRGLHKSFGSTPALRGADVAVAAGEVLAVMGPSGAGKSTLLHCLAGLIRPDAGDVVFEGRLVNRMPDRERSRLRRSVFGYVFQFGQLVPELRVLENIALPLLLAGKGRRTAFEAAGQWLPRLGLVDVGDRLAGEVSGGQGQRAAIARALIAKPRVVFADEPTGSLDTVAGDEVMELLVTAAKTEGAGVVVVTHESRVAAYADRQITVRDGRIVQPARAA
ncbi:ABC transporter ATP-binding protein [Dactylosporangium cerinum]|uniref:ABC transporter ATP-binding protein n=1 Tax=Dactylosporangium cerinum TaxID=1434730 RepID=A0ABV9VQT3_9ACTN